MEDYHKSQFNLFEGDIDDDKALCAVANERRVRLFDSPTQSNFRVYALLIVEVKSENCNPKRYLIDGANSEPGVSCQLKDNLDCEPKYLFLKLVYRWFHMC